VSTVDITPAEASLDCSSQFAFMRNDRSRDRRVNGGKEVVRCSSHRAESIDRLQGLKYVRPGYQVNDIWHLLLGPPC